MEPKQSSDVFIISLEDIEETFSAQLQECVICLELLEKSHFCQLAPCKHEFCWHCLQKLVATIKILVCPLCRASINFIKGDHFSVYLHEDQPVNHVSRTASSKCKSILYFLIYITAMCCLSAISSMISSILK